MTNYLLKFSNKEEYGQFVTSENFPTDKHACSLIINSENTSDNSVKFSRPFKEKLEYIYTDTTEQTAGKKATYQYIDTGIMLTHNDEMYFKFLAKDVTKQARIVGQYGGYYNMLYINGNTQWASALVAGDWMTSGVTASANTIYTVTTTGTTRKTKVNSTTKTHSNTKTPDPTVTCWIGYVNSTTGTNRNLNGNYYEFYIKDMITSQYKMYLIPVQDTNNNGCMFDIITNNLFYNANETSGHYLCGPIASS